MKKLFNYEYWGFGVFEGGVNMALEEFLIQRIAQNNPQKHIAATRFYSFDTDSIVLGYAQDTDVIRKLDPRVGLTRRMTGGSHIQTGPNTIAYTFVIPRDNTFATYGQMRAYYAGCVANALKKLGIGDITVDNPSSTINVGERVIASHAIWWGVKSALLHGLIILSPYDVDKITSRMFLAQRTIGNKIYSEYMTLKNLPTVVTELQNKRSAPSLRHRMLYGMISKVILDEVSGEGYRPYTINNSIIQQSYRFLAQRYGAPQWVDKHQPVFTSQETEEIPGEELSGDLKKNLGYCLFCQVSDNKFKKMSEPI
ncbi:hypothetical protein MYX06_04515 [Patescibacteria group bacterium AH-259-L05]|nr:hypothetical protein [Patescibacteria group bacterium AH-259-L05]